MAEHLLCNRIEFARFPLPENTCTGASSRQVPLAVRGQRAQTPVPLGTTPGCYCRTEPRVLPLPPSSCRGEEEVSEEGSQLLGTHIMPRTVSDVWKVQAC